MKLCNDGKQLIGFGVGMLCLLVMPLMTSAYSAPQDLAQTQQMDKSNSQGSDTSKSDNPPPKPPPKPGPRDGGADD